MGPCSSGKLNSQMCGIAGFIGPWGGRLLSQMLNSMAHRGPDGRAVWYDHASSVALGHLRLSIIDLSENANQPMQSADGRYVISYNGELYNYRELRRELETRGVRFRTASDTEVLLELLALDGERCLNRLNGIFAFALWDRVDRRMLIARDQLGIKPLYFAQLPDGFIFASELKALVQCPDLPRDLDPSTVLNHLGFVWSSSNATMLKAGRKLRPGHFAWVDANGKAKIERYYTIPVPRRDRTPVKPEALLELFDRVVADQMVADVPVGAFLSGGVDSSAIVASMCRATDPARIVTFCASVTKERSRADNFGDDITYARLMAGKLGVQLVEVPTESNLVDELQDMLWDLDEPTADFAALQTRKIAAVARRNGLKVLLSGTGGDDLFTGYGRHTLAHVWTLLDKVPGARALVGAAISGFPSTSVLGRRLARLGTLLPLSEDDMLIEAMSFSSTAPLSRLALLSPEARQTLNPDAVRGALPAILARTSGLEPSERMLQLDLDGFLPDLNLNYADKMAMRESIELRVPILDPRLVAFAMTIPTSQKIALRQTKRIFREALRDRLPPEILTRPKQGFGTPVRAWLAGPAQDVLNQTTAPQVLEQRGLFDPAAVAQLRRDFDAHRGDVAFTLFTVVAVELWCRSLDSHPTLSLDQARAAA